MEKIKTKIKPIVGILIVAIILLSLILNKFCWGHDFGGHMSNIDLFKAKLPYLDLFSFRMVDGRIARGFGYGSFIFYPCISYMTGAIVASIISIFGLHISQSISYTMLLISFLSGLAMYSLTNKVYKDRMIAFLCAVAYMSSTYFLCDIYTRTALAECFVFLFVPIVFSSLYELFYGDHYMFYILFILGYVGMINSHLVMSIYLTILIVILLIINFRKALTLNNIKRLAIASIMVLLISSPYLVLLVQHKLLGNYIVFDNSSMFSVGQLNENTINIYNYLNIGQYNSDGITLYINQVTLISLLLVIGFQKKIFKNDVEKKFFINILIFALLAMIMASKIINWEYVPMFLRNIQFPWRLCSLISFGVAALSGAVIRIFKNDMKKVIFIIASTLTVILGLNSISKNLYIDTKIYDYGFNMGAQNEYLPVNVSKYWDYYEYRDQSIIVVDGYAQISSMINNTPYLKANVTLESDKAVLEIPRIYYLGYNIVLEEDNGIKHSIKYYENEKGFIEFKIKNSGTITVNYTSTKLCQIFTIISPLSLITFNIILVLKRKNKKPI